MGERQVAEQPNLRLITIDPTTLKRECTIAYSNYGSSHRYRPVWEKKWFQQTLAVTKGQKYVTEIVRTTKDVEVITDREINDLLDVEHPLKKAGPGKTMRCLNYGNICEANPVLTFNESFSVATEITGYIRFGSPQIQQLGRNRS